ncbi:MAG: UDP-N-acetylmuramoyl-L-alanyl-D-glutamate--2,6-diaminopimelate ligase, partial [Bacteroidales bacterium]|nr:UDP-N-acetylmuramoyl-L-alanyl-D-glutamate--2,6-diaminopimelate ligase [Bacteroidales bacterium]
MKQLQDLLSHIAIINSSGDLKQNITGLAIDSRQVKKDYLFIAQKGTQVNGHDYIATAIEKGAIAILHTEEVEINDNICYIKVEDTQSALGLVAGNFYEHPSQKMKLVGITGTNGKTTIATLLYRLFKQLGYKTGLLSTVSNYIDNTAITATHTTPDAIAINSLMAEMVEAGCDYCFMEVSSHAIDQKRIEGLDFDGGVFTNLSRDHLDYHNTFEEYRDVKKRFFDALKSDAFALTNTDDKNGKFMQQNTKATKRSYTCRAMGDYRIKVLDHNFEGMMLQIDQNEAFMQFVGAFN